MFKPFKKKLLLCLLSLCILTISIAILLNVNVAMRQGINYQWHTVKIPLYLKILDLFDRHYNYKQIVKRIINGTNKDEEKVLKIFEWTYENIRKATDDYPIIDDHVLNIIIRGYGVNDQMSDVFTVLCNYAGVDAFFTWVYSKDGNSRIPLSYVQLNNKWHLFDPYIGNYFINRNGEFATINDLKTENWEIKGVSGLNRSISPDYTDYFNNLQEVVYAGMHRANIQSPFNRLFFEIKSLFSQ